MAVGEHEKQQLTAQATALQEQVQSERTERLTVEQNANQLAQGVGQLARNYGELTKEIRDNRPISANVLFNDFLANRVQTTFSATKKGLFGNSVRDKDTKTVFTTDGKQVYALVEVEDTAFSFREIGADWDKISVRFDRPPGLQVDGLGAGFPGGRSPGGGHSRRRPAGRGAGRQGVPARRRPLQVPGGRPHQRRRQGLRRARIQARRGAPGYVRVDNRIFKRLFGDFAPSRGTWCSARAGSSSASW